MLCYRQIVLMFNHVDLQQIRASAQTSVDNALERAQSALNEGVATRLNALCLEIELEELQVEIEELRAVLKKRDSDSTLGENRTGK